jgi:hypothetical protein
MININRKFNKKARQIKLFKGVAVDYCQIRLHRNLTEGKISEFHKFHRCKDKVA